MVELIDEMKRRQARFKGRVKNIRGWNREPRCQPKMPYIVLIVDELSVIMYDNQMRDAVQELLKKAVAIGRATGVHLVLCTQVVKVDVLPTMVVGNVPAKMVFNCANMRTSMMVLGHGGAAGLAPPGRGFWQNGAEEETSLALAGIRRIARESGMTTAELAIKWALAGRGISCCLIGARTVAKLDANVRAAAGALSSDTIQALNAVTINAAYAIGRQDRVGSLALGKELDLLLLDVPDYPYLAYHLGIDPLRAVIKSGRVVVRDRRLAEEA